MTTLQRAEAAEHAMSQELDRVVVKSVLFIQDAYKYAREHKWYMTSRLITVNDLYAFDPTVPVQLEEFTDVVGRRFKQPKEGLGFDQSPSTHMWRTIIAPTKYL